MYGVGLTIPMDFDEDGRVSTLVRGVKQKATV
jgi:hypothetical protein